MALTEEKIKYLRRACWLVPVLAAVTLAVRINVDVGWTGDLFAWLAVVAVAVTGYLLTNRISPAGPGQTRLTLECVTAVLCTVLLGAATAIYPMPWRSVDDDPDRYLGRKNVRIGITGALPGWSRSLTRGFDNALADYIAARYHTTWVPVAILGQDRGAMLDNNTVDLVISTYTINEPRAQAMDLAGPYYVDTTGVWRNKAKSDVPATQALLCQAQGTTGVGAAGRFRRQFQGVKFARVYNRATTVECLDDFRLQSSKTTYVATDWSILRAYDTNLAVTDGNDYPPLSTAPDGTLQDPGPPPATDQDRAADLQRYGIAIRNHHPQVCRALTDAINDFLASDSGFAQAYDENLQAILGPVKDDWHNPRRADAPGTPGRFSCL